MKFNLIALIVLFIFISNASFANGSLTYCRTFFGDESHLTYEPVESNRGVRITHSIFKGAKIERDEKVPRPTGFRCALFNIEPELSKCPNGMHFDKKRNNRKICLSKVFSLKELCPSELAKDWPDIAKEICAKKN